MTNLLTGAPASLSKQFQKGDRVVQVDGEKVDEHGTNLTKMLIGSDIPGSLVKVYFQRGNAQRKDVTLKRACTTELADRRRMFQLFTQVLHFLSLTLDAVFFTCGPRASFACLPPRDRGSAPASPEMVYLCLFRSFLPD